MLPDFVLSSSRTVVMKQASNMGPRFSRSIGVHPGNDHAVSMASLPPVEQPSHPRHMSASVGLFEVHPGDRTESSVGSTPLR